MLGTTPKYVFAINELREIAANVFSANKSRDSISALVKLLRVINPASDTIGEIPQVKTIAGLCSALDIDSRQPGKPIFLHHPILKENTIVVVPTAGKKVVHIGDVHQDLMSLEFILADSGFFDNPERFILVFHGDYVGRGTEIRAVPFILALRRLYPSSVILLRGNHETSDVLWPAPGFIDIECRWIMEELQRLPLAAVLVNESGYGHLCVHGGVGFGYSSDYKLEIPSGSVADIVVNASNVTWSTFVDDSRSEGCSSYRGAGVYFGPQAVSILFDMGFISLTRGHDHVVQRQEIILQNGNSFPVVTLFANFALSSHTAYKSRSHPAPEHPTYFCGLGGGIQEVKVSDERSLKMSQQIHTIVMHPLSVDEGKSAEPNPPLIELLSRYWSAERLVLIDDAWRALTPEQLRGLKNSRGQTLLHVLSKELPYENKRVWMLGKVNDCLNRVELDPNVAVDDGSKLTSLHLSLKRSDRNDPLIHLLLDHPSIDVGVCDQFGNPPLFFLIQGFYYDSEEMDSLLAKFLKHPTALPITYSNIYGDTLLHIICKGLFSRFPGKCLNFLSAIIAVRGEDEFVSALRMENLRGETPMDLFMQSLGSFEKVLPEETEEIMQLLAQGLDCDGCTDVFDVVKMHYNGRQFLLPACFNELCERQPIVESVGMVPGL